MHEVEDGISQLGSLVLFLFAVATLILIYNTGVDASQAARKALADGQQLTKVTEDTGLAGEVEANADNYESYKYNNNNISDDVFYVEGKTVTRHVLKDNNGNILKMYYTYKPVGSANED